MDLCKLADLTSWREGTLESHVARGAGGAEERFLVVGKHTILGRCPDEAACLSVPLYVNGYGDSANEMKRLTLFLVGVWQHQKDFPTSHFALLAYSSRGPPS